jgi:hypothetical protein
MNVHEQLVERMKRLVHRSKSSPTGSRSFRPMGDGG